MTIAIIIFILTYILLLALPKYRTYVALISAFLFVILGILPTNKIISSINWNVLMMIGGTMGTVYLFIESKMPSLMSDLIIEKTHSVKWTIIALSLFAGIVSAFIDNVATVLMIAPVAIEIAKKQNISPVNSIIAISIASNLQGAATLVGDTTSILLGGYANMNFLDFFIYQGKPGLFFIVEIGAIVSTLVLVYVFRKDNAPVTINERTKVLDYFPSFLLGGTVVTLIIASLLNVEFEYINGVICISYLLIGIIRELFKKNIQVIKLVIKEIDWMSLGLLTGLFIVVAGISEAGVIDAVANLFVKLAGNNKFLIYTLIVWASVVFSAFIDNIPYVATMLPVTQGISAVLGIDPTLLYFGLLIGATLGGNNTPVGASANITSLGILRKEGYEVKSKDFMKISVPFTLSAVVTGYLLVWFIFA